MDGIVHHLVNTSQMITFFFSIIKTEVHLEIMKSIVRHRRIVDISVGSILSGKERQKLKMHERNEFLSIIWL